MKEISCSSYRGDKKHYRAFGGKCLSTMENGSQNFLSYKHQDFLVSKKSEPKMQGWGKDSCDWTLNNVRVFVHSFCDVYEVATQWGGYVCLPACLSDHPQISSL